MVPAILYTRVSSERQVNEGGGLQSQEHRCRSYAQSCGYAVLATFSDDGVSGALIERPGIQALLSFLRTQAGEVVVVIDDISRIARDVIAHVSLRAAIKAAGGKLESPSFTFGETATDELLETIMAATAQYGRKGNREQVLNRQKARLQLGYWTFPAPPGYRYEKHPTHKKIIVPTPQARKTLARGLEGYALGRLQTNRELALYLKENAFFETAYRDNITILEKRVMRILDVLPLYAGFIEYPAWGIERVVGQHEAILAPAALARLEERLGRKAKPVGAARADADSRFILRNFVRCGGCGRPLTGCLAKGKYPRYFCYYQAGCDRYGHSFSAAKLEPAFEELLVSLAPKDAFIEVATTVTNKLWEKRVAEWGRERLRLERQVVAAQEDIGGLVRRLGRSSDAIAVEIEKEVGTLKEQAHDVGMQLARYQEAPPDYGQAWERVSTLFRNPHGYWKNGSENAKRTVHRMVFTVPPAFGRNEGFSTYELSLPYLVLANFGHTKEEMVDLAGESWHQFMDTVLRWSQELSG